VIDSSEISVGKADDSGVEAMIDSSEISVGKADDSGVEAVIDLSEISRTIIVIQYYLHLQ
jgi:hypothetical protein